MTTAPIPLSSGRPDGSDSQGSVSEGRLLEQASRGNHSAIEALFGRYSSWLRRWARGRLPSWARDGIDTGDLVQDTLHHTFARLAWFRSRHATALRIYLRRAIENRIRDELRRATRRQDVVMPDASVRPSDEGAPQLRQLMEDEVWRRYIDGLKRLTARDRRLIVGRAELGCNYEQLAFVERMPSPDAARMALRRALVRLSDIMADAER